MRARIVAVVLSTLVASAAADPQANVPSSAPGASGAAPGASAATSAGGSSASSSTSSAPGAQPLTRTASVQPFLVFDPPPPLVPSLRLEAARIAGERFENDWRYPEPGPIFGFDDGMWFMGYGHYHPRTARSAALHGGSMAATFLGEILLKSGTPAAGVGLLLTGATLDAAAADVDRDAEARRKR